MCRITFLPIISGRHNENLSICHFFIYKNKIKINNAENKWIFICFFGR